MPEAVAARFLARRLLEAVVRAAFARRGRARWLVCAVLVAASQGGNLPVLVPAAWAVGPSSNANVQAGRPSLPLPQAPAPVALAPRGASAAGNARPGLPSASGTSTSTGGPVRLEPARMPFYVATRGTTTIYVLGTLHVGDPADYPPAQPFRPAVLAALAASPTLALELSPDDLLVSQDDVTKYGVCTYPCLPRLLPDPLWHKLAARLRGNPAALDEIRKMRPWLASLLVETYDSLSAGLQTEYGTEAQLQNVYLRQRGRIVGLETLSEQMRAFTGLSLAQQREMLAQDLVQTPAENVADVQTLHRLWRVGDADAITAWEAAKSEKLARDKQISASIDNKILFDRNRRFVARMVAIAAPNKPVFVAIGALHLGGRNGVLQLLRQRGFVVDPS
jgi:hypothetical protein